MRSEMTVASFTSSSFAVVPAPGGEQALVLHTLLCSTDAKALSDALGWMRTSEFLAPGLEDAGQILAMRAMMALVDRLDEVGDAGPGGPVTFVQDEVALLAEATARYVSTRADDYAAPRERDRLARLGVLRDRIFDVVADFAGAADEARHLSRGA